VRSFVVTVLFAACGGASAPRPAPPPSALDCQEELHDPSARDRCIGYALDQVMTSAVFHLYKGPRLTAYVGQVGARVAAHAGRPDLCFTFRVLDDPDPQGHALLGGYVYVTTGAIARLGSEAQLAALLAHEVAHVALDHGDGLLEIDDDLVLSDPGAVRRRLAHARDDEIEADERAVSLLVAAGYDPSAMLAMLRRVDCAPDPIDPLDRSHEPLDRRLARIARAIDGRAGGEVGESRYHAELPAGILPDRASDRTIGSSCGGPGQPSPRRAFSPRSPGRRPPRAR